MNPLAALLALAAAGLATLVVVELRPGSAVPELAIASTPLAGTAPPTPAALDARAAPLVDTLLARPVFTQTRRPPTAPSSAPASATSAMTLPRMTAILIDGPRRSAIFAPSDPGQVAKPIIVGEGGRVGPFTVQTIEPQQVIVIGPEGKRIVRTSFDPTLPPPAAPPPYGLGAPQFPGIAPGGPPLVLPPTTPSAGYGLPQSAGAAR